MRASLAALLSARIDYNRQRWDASYARARAALTATSQMVQVVSMLDVPTVAGSASHQSNDVRGEQYSAFVF